MGFVPMRVPSRLIAVALILLSLPTAAVGGGLAPAPPRHPDNPADLEARIQRESNPVRKAKYQIRLSRVKLLQAIDAYDRGKLDEGRRLLSAFLEQIRQSWQTLEASGRGAVKQPQGFKELDIELREDARLLVDLAHRVSFVDRDPIEKARLEAEHIREEVLRALFPSERPAEHRVKTGAGLTSRVESGFRKRWA